MNLLKIRLADQLLAEDLQKSVNENSHQPNYKEISLLYQNDSYHLGINDEFIPLNTSFSLLLETTSLELVVEKVTKNDNSHQLEHCAYDFLPDDELNAFIASTEEHPLDFLAANTACSTLNTETNLLAIHDLFKLPATNNKLKLSENSSVMNNLSNKQGNILQELGIINDNFPKNF